MHLHGWGVKADPTKAYQYFQNAKKAGHIGATYQFARMHDIGIAPVRRYSGSAHVSRHTLPISDCNYCARW